MPILVAIEPFEEWFRDKTFPIFHHLFIQYSNNDLKSVEEQINK